MSFTLDLTSLEPVNRNPYPFTPIQLEWLAALESGNYKQGEGYLQDMQDRYCCLGVAAILAGCDKRPMTGNFPTAYNFKMPEESADLWSRAALPYGARKKLGLRASLGEFYRDVKFPGLSYGLEPQHGLYDPNRGHTSLASMNDARLIPDGNGDWRGFNFAEIAAYIRHDPWNVFEAPKDNAQPAFSPPPASGGGG